MDTLLKEVIQDIFGQAPSQRYLYIVIIVLLVGLPYLIKIWREIFSPKHYLEVRKLQLDILKTYLEILSPDEQAQRNEIRKIADKIFNDPETKRDPIRIMFGRGGFAELSYQLTTGLILLFWFFIGVVVIWSPLLFVVRHNWSDLFKGLVIMLGLFGPLFVLAKTDGEIKYVNAFSIGVLSLPIAAGVIMFAKILLGIVESLLIS